MSDEPLPGIRRHLNVTLPFRSTTWEAAQKGDLVYVSNYWRAPKELRHPLNAYGPFRVIDPYRRIVLPPGDSSEIAIPQDELIWSCVPEEMVPLPAPGEGASANADPALDIPEGLDGIFGGEEGGKIDEYDC